MAGYVEYLQVGSGEAWPVRDVDAQEKLATMSESMISMGESMTAATEDIDKLKEDVTALSEQMSGEPDTEDTASLPLEGGTMTGPINMGGNKVTNLPNPESDTDAATKAYVDDVIPASTIMSVSANENIAISLTEGQAVTFTYVTSRTTNGDVLITLNGAAPTNANYIHSGVTNGQCFTGGIVTYSGSMFNAQVTGTIRLLNGRAIISTHDFRGNGSGIGYSMNFWDNVTAVGSISFSAAGSLAFDYVGKGQLAFG